MIDPDRARRAGLALALLGALAGLAAGAWWALAELTGWVAMDERVTAFGVAGLVVGLVGALVLLAFPDRLPPEERP